MFFDCTFDRDFISTVDTYQPDLIAVCEDNFNFLTKMCLLENRELAFEIAAAARVRGIPAIVNSSDSTNNPQAYLAAGFDRVILGELESTLSEAVPRAWRAAMRTPAAASSTIPRAAIADLDELPMPAWDLLDIEAYRRAWMRSAWILFAESRGEPRLPVSLQLVREAGSWRCLPAAFARSRGCGDGVRAGLVRAGSNLVRGRHLRLSPPSGRANLPLASSAAA